MVVGEHAVKAAAQCYLDRTVSINETASSLAHAMLTAAAPHLAAVRVKGDDLVERVARAWASIDGKSGLFDECKASKAMEDQNGTYEGYMAEARELIKRAALELSAARDLALEEILRELSGNPGELIDMMAAAIRGDTVYDDTPWATLSEDRKIGWRGDAERALAVVKDYLTARRPSEQAVTEAMELARAVLAQSITAGHNVPGPTPEDIEKAFWALDAALKYAIDGMENITVQEVRRRTVHAQPASEGAE